MDNDTAGAPHRCHYDIMLDQFERAARSAWEDDSECPGISFLFGGRDENGGHPLLRKCIWTDIARNGDELMPALYSIAEDVRANIIVSIYQARVASLDIGTPLVGDDPATDPRTREVLCVMLELPGAHCRLRTIDILRDGTTGTRLSPTTQVVDHDEPVWMGTARQYERMSRDAQAEKDLHAKTGWFGKKPEGRA